MKLALWRDLERIIQTIPQSNVVLGGDFNSFLHFSEKYGGIQKETWSQFDFLEWVVRNNLMDIVMKNGVFTWNNKRLGFSCIVDKLDRFFFRGGLSLFPFKLKYLIPPISRSNHYPIQLELCSDKKPLNC